MDYFSAERELGNRDTRKVGNNTYLERDRWSPGTIFLRLHRTRIVAFHEDGSVRLNSGGWQTVTTKERLNWVSGIRVFQQDWQWYVYIPKTGETVPYSDGMVLFTD